MRRTLRPRPVISQGECYDLKTIFDQLNAEYFDAALTLPISWTGSAQRTVRRQRRLGSYNLRTGLIKIHRLLDSAHFPPYFISYVVYHEMLHHLFPPQKERGRRNIHHSLFREKEKEFKEYALAKQWEKENLTRILHGRTQ